MATPTGDTDEAFDDLHSLHDVRLSTHLRDDPEHLLVDKLKATKTYMTSRKMKLPREDLCNKMVGMGSNTYLYLEYSETSLLRSPMGLDK